MEKVKIYLKSKKDQSLRRFHPWVFSGAIKKMEGGQPKDGEIVEVFSNKGSFLGAGHYQEAGSISVRILSFETSDIDDSFWKDKITIAWNLRMKLGLLNETNNVFRLIHAEGDGMPGLIVDYYNGTAVLQSHSSGVYHNRENIVNALKDVLGKDLKAIYDKSAEALPKHAEIDAKNEYLYQAEEPNKMVIENGHTFRVDWETGQKTGFFIDQRDNRELIGKYAEGKKVLNTFCYSGGFSIYALNKGAEVVHSLDSSQKAIDLVNKNVEFAENQDKHKSITEDAMDFIKELPEEYDIIVLDPPAFAKHRDVRHKAIQGYKRLNAAAMRQIKPGGIIFTFSCSQVVDKSMFNSTIMAAAIGVGRKIKILHQLHQPADHPINIYHPESEYLKGLVIQVD